MRQKITDGAVMRLLRIPEGMGDIRRMGGMIEMGFTRLMKSETGTMGMDRGVNRMHPRDQKKAIYQGKQSRKIFKSFSSGFHAIVRRVPPSSLCSGTDAKAIIEYHPPVYEKR